MSLPFPQARYREIVKYYCPEAIKLKWFALGFYKKVVII